MAIRYLTQPDNSGWLVVRFGDRRTSLPRYLKVDLLRTRDGRDYFKALEGPYQNQEGSVTLKPDGTSYLSARGRHLSGGKVKVDKSTGELWYGGTGPVSVVTSGVGYDSAPVGTHDLEIPDAPHAGGNNYISRSSYATVWFRIGHSGSSYLHTGMRSAGCATVTDVEQWNAIYGYLIDRRKGDGRSVGTIEIIE